jgi:hypothetical protein
MDWILLIMLTTSRGQFVDKIAVPMPSESVCVAAKREIRKQEHLIPQSVCITKDHWLGKRPMSGVHLD